MSFYSDASLVLIPSGYKDQKIYAAKPTDGLGDLVFSRASSATRVASNGLIEKVRTNVVLYSNDFSNAAWNQTGVTATSGETDYLGGTNAWKITPSTSNIVHYITQNTPSSVYSSSIYIKAAGYTTARIITGGFAAAASIDLITGATTAPAKTTNVGNGWWRFEIYNATAGTGFYIYPVGTGAYAGDGTSGILVSFAQAETGDIATDYIETTTAAVSVGPVSGLPRLDYLNSSCPRLLLEPQRTNLALYSEQFNNAEWTKTRATITANQTTAPDGYTSADLYTDGTFTGNVSFVEQDVTVGASGTTCSVFVKKGTADYVSFGFYDTAFHGFVVNTNTWASTYTVGSASSFTAINYGNGWYRLSMYKAAAVNEIFFSFAVAASSTGANYNGTGALTAYFWGAQVEASGATYATSYIPTLSTSVTRVADLASKTGISSLIGQTEGAFMIDVNLDARATFTYFALAPNLASTSNYLGIGLNATTILFESVISASLEAGITLANSATGRFKIAVAYKANDFVMYVNGTLVGTDTSGSVPTCSQIGLYEYNQTPSIKYNQALVFKTRLTNAQLLALTSL